MSTRLRKDWCERRRRSALNRVKAWLTLGKLDRDTIEERELELEVDG